MSTIEEVYRTIEGNTAAEKGTLVEINDNSSVYSTIMYAVYEKELDFYYGPYISAGAGEFKQIDDKLSQIQEQLSEFES